MAQILKQSTAIEVKVGPFLDSTDGFTAETALTITQSEVLLAKNAGDWTQKTETTSLVHESNGWYRCLLDATDTGTLGMLMLQIAESGALPVWETFWVVTANVYDTLFSTDVFDTSVTQWLGQAVAAVTVNGVPEVDVTHIGGTAVTAAAGIPEVKVASIATDAITAAAIAPDAIGASELAAGAVDEILDDALADSVPADGSLPTVRQALYMIWQFLSERSVSGTTLTVKKADGSTTLMTFTLDSATAPTSQTRAT